MGVLIRVSDKQQQVSDKQVTIVTMQRLLTRNRSSTVFQKERLTSYPWHLLWKTCLLWFSFFMLGLSDSVRGPTLLDLKDLINEDVSAVSSTFALRAFGGLVGCFLSGLILDFLSPSSRYLFLAIATLVISFCTTYLPYSPNLLVMQGVSVLFGLFNGSFHTAANVLLLRIWTGHNSSPYMYAMHFFFGIGAFLAPILAKPFLIEVSIGEVVDETGKETFHGDSSISQGVTKFWTIQTLYPLIGICLFISIPGYIYHFVQGLRLERKEALVEEEVTKKDIEEDIVPRCKKYLLIALMAFYYFTFCGLESSFRNFTSAFSVSSSLNLSRQQAADVLAVFYFTFAVFRALLIPLSTLASPVVVLWSSLSVLGLGTMLLSIMAEYSIVLLKVGVALVGAGVASLFASGMLWLRSVIPVTNRVGAVVTMSCCIGAQVYSIVIGAYIETQAMVFIYLMLGTVVALTITFGLASLLGYFIRKHQNIVQAGQ